MSSKKSIKKRNWGFILYPESAPENWFELLQKSGLSGAVSPLHDKDIDPDGNPKKAHHHIILCYPGPTTYNNVAAFTDSLHATIPQALESVRGNYRYFTHLDNPDKAQYNAADIRAFGGFEYRDYVELTKTEVTKLFREIHELIRSADIYEYSELLDVLLDSDMTDAYDVAMSHTLALGKYIDSRRHKKAAAAEGLPSGNLGAAREGGGDK